VKRAACVGMIVGLVVTLGTACRTNHRKYAGALPPPRIGCHVHGAFPDNACTPGAAMTDDLNIICGQSTTTRRNVGQAEKRQVFMEYGIPYPAPRGAYEVDHFIPLELGGSNAKSNLWPEAAQPMPGFHEKDRVENYLHKQACSGMISLQEARQEITADWVRVYATLN
jgi:hypothetical protein